MFTAIQTRNIVNEKYNHKFYYLYRLYCESLAYGVNKAIRTLHYGHCMYVREHTDMALMVLNQIAAEMRSLGYECWTGNERRRRKGRQYYYIRITWH